MPDPKAKAAAEALVAEGDKDVAQMRTAYHERMRGKPTPTQHECDLIKAGAPPDQKEPTGAMPYKPRQMEGGAAPASYQTRVTRPAAGPARTANTPAE